MKTPRSPLWPIIRTRSPRIAPPENGLDGSTATTPTVRPAARAAAIRRSTRVLLPAPGGPVMPMVQARSGRGPSRRISASAAGPPRSTTLMARASARGVSNYVRLGGTLAGMEREDTIRSAAFPASLPSRLTARPHCLPGRLDPRPRRPRRLLSISLAPAVEQERQPHRAEAFGVDDALGDGVAGGPVRGAATSAVLVRLVADLADLVRHVDPHPDHVLAAVAADVPVEAAIGGPPGPAAEPEHRLERIHEAHDHALPGDHCPLGSNSTGRRGGRVCHNATMPQPPARKNPFDALARYYDWEHADYDVDVPLFQDFARRTGGPILELACGSGRLMAPLLELGERVVGIDSSGPMLERARHALGSAGLLGRATLHEADVRRFTLDERFRLAIFGLDSFGLLLSIDDQLAALRRIRQHLVPGGLLILDLSNGNGRGAEPTDELVLQYEGHDPATGLPLSKWTARSTDHGEQVDHYTYFYDEVGEDRGCAPLNRPPRPALLRSLRAGAAAAAGRLRPRGVLRLVRPGAVRGRLRAPDRRGRPRRAMTEPSDERDRRSQIRAMRGPMTSTMASPARRKAQTTTVWEASPVGKVGEQVYSDGGSGESTRTERLAGATPQFPRGAIPRGATSSTAYVRKDVRRRVAAQRLQRMGRKVRPPHSRQIPSLFVSAVLPVERRSGPLACR